MKKTIVISVTAATIVTGIAMVSILVNSENPSVQLSDMGPDPVLMSFERELNHEPAPATRARGESVDQDLLYRTVNSVHWTPEASDTTADQSAKKPEERQE